MNNTGINGGYNVNQSIYVEWIGGEGKMLKVTLFEALPGKKPEEISLVLSRYQTGILSMFDQASEVTRAEIYYFLSKIWGEPIPYPIPKKYTVAMTRLIKRLKETGLIVEHNRLLYRTMRGQAIWIGVKEELLKRKQAGETENPG